MAGFLDGALVLDFTRVLAGPFCTMTLADLGARVIKVESPEGDEARGMGPFVDGHSLYFASINRGKESVALNLKHPRAVELALGLAARADVLVENYRPGTLERLGLGYDAVHERNAGIVYVSLSGFGQVGPYRDRGAYDVIIQAMGGLMGITGPAGGGPTRVGASLGDIVPALYATVAVLAALQRRERTGEGCHVDLAMMDAVVAVVENAMARYWVSGEDPGPIGNRHPAIAPFSTFATADGQIVIACGNDALWRRLCAALGAPALAEDARFTTNALRADRAEDLAVAMEGVLRAHGTDHWLEILLEAGIPCAKVNRMSDLLNDPHLRARDMIVEMDQPHVGRLPVPGAPIKATGVEIDLGDPSPALGAHTRPVLRELLDVDAAELELLERDGAIGVPEPQSP